MRRYRFTFPVLASVCFVATSFVRVASAQTTNVFYVSPAGTDGALGTVSDPWQTLSYAVAQLVAGDTLYIRGGVYTGSANVIDASATNLRGGTSFSNPITIAGYPSEFPVLAPNGMTAISLRTATQQYLIFQDFVIDGSNTNQGDDGQLVYVSGGANHNRFLRLEIKNSFGFGMVFSNYDGNAPFNEIIYSRIHDNGRDPNPSCDCELHGIYIETSDNRIEGNDIYNNASGFGIQLYNDAGPVAISRNIIDKNRLHGNGGSSLFEAGGLVVAWGDSNSIYDNLVYGNTGDGILVYSNSTNTYVYNNTIYGNTDKGIQFQYCSGAVAAENLLFGNGAPSDDYSGCATSFSNLTTDPLFVNPGSGDFHLQSGSPAIGAGPLLPGVAVDFDGYPRQQPTDLGALTFQP
jgi:parallel beta-helix repeat protein